MQFIQQKSLYLSMKAGAFNKSAFNKVIRLMNNLPSQKTYTQGALVLFASCLMSLPAWAEQFCFTTPGNAIPLSTPTSQFTDNGNGTVTDTRTGLMWKKCIEGLSGSDCSTGTPTRSSWEDALNAAQSSTFAGYNDWRMPNYTEFFSIVELACYDPAINLEVFPEGQFGLTFWTSTPAFIDTGITRLDLTPSDTTAQTILFLSGQGNSGTDRDNINLRSWLVRGGN